MRALFFTVCPFMWPVFPCSGLLLHQFVTYRAAWVAVTLCGGVSLDVPGGRLIRVEGPNGSGKSTLLAARQSDTVLRQVLAWDGVHVACSRPSRTRRGPASPPPPARSGPVATLLVALGGGVLLGLAGAYFEVLISPPVTGRLGGLPGTSGAAIEHP